MNSTLPRPTHPDFYLDPAELRKLAVGMPARPAFLDSGACSQNEYIYLSSVLDVFYKGQAKWSRPNGGMWTLMHDEGFYVYDLSDFKLPLLSTKKVFNRSWLIETLWFLKGSTDIEFLKTNNVSIWDSWVKEGTGRYDESGKLIGGSIGHGGYGAMWRKWNDTRYVTNDKWSVDLDNDLQARGYARIDGSMDATVYKRTIDQIADVIHQLKHNPDSRRIIVTAWNPDLTDETVLPPCFEGSALVSTPEGYKPISSIQIGDLVYSGEGNVRPVNKVWTTKYKGKMLSIRPDYISEEIKCTPNHPFLVKGKGWVEAGKLTKEDKIAINVPKHGDRYIYPYFITRRIGPNNSQLIHLPAHHELTDDDYYTLGYFLGNGWASLANNLINFAIPHSKKDEILDRIRRTIKVSEKPGNSPNVATYNTRSDKFIELFRSFGHGAFNKRIPEFIFTSPRECKDSFLAGFMAADGHVSEETGRIQITTVSPSIAYGIQRLALISGKVASVQKQKRPPTTVIEGRLVNQRDTYNIGISPKHQVLSTEIESDYAWIGIRKITEYEDDLYIHNLDVDVDHTYTVQNIVNHNCHSLFQFTSMATGREDGKRELTLRLYQRSCDILIGKCFNIAQYAFLAHLIAHLTNHVAVKFVHCPTDLHIYEDQLALLPEQMSREPLVCDPRLVIADTVTSIDDLKFEDFAIVGYGDETHHPVIKYPVAV